MCPGKRSVIHGAFLIPSYCIFAAKMKLIALTLVQKLINASSSALLVSCGE